MFADNTTIISTKKNLPELFTSINKELMNIGAWLIANKLCVNIKKINYIIFQTVGYHCPENLTVRLRNVPIQKVSPIKFLGLHLQENLSWKLHMEDVLTKVRCGLSIVRKAKLYFNQESLLILYPKLGTAHEFGVPHSAPPLHLEVSSALRTSAPFLGFGVSLLQFRFSAP